MLPEGSRRASAEASRRSTRRNGRHTMVADENFFTTVRSRRPVVLGCFHHSNDSCPSDEVAGGFFFEFEPFRTASGPCGVSESTRSRRWRVRDRAAATASS